MPTLFAVEQLEEGLTAVASSENLPQLEKTLRIRAIRFLRTGNAMITGGLKILQKLDTVEGAV